MSTITDLLKGNFTILDLGASTPANNIFLNKIRQCVTLLEIDAIEPGVDTDQKGFYKRIILKAAVSNEEGEKKFYRRNYFACSSFLKVNETVPKMYGMELMVQEKEEITLHCTTVPSLLKQENIDHIDFFKTDLEGLDLTVIKSSEAIVKKSLALQCELRFQPFFIGEPHFYEACAYIETLGFELIHLVPENWKYNTKNSKYIRDGRVAWGDFVFFMKEEKLKEIYHKEELNTVVLKQILIAKSLGLNSHAEYLFEKWENHFTPSIKEELKDLMCLEKSIQYRLSGFFSSIAHVKGYAKFSRYIQKVASASAVDNFHKWWVK
jgi:FkbM family methyltransferase